MITQNLRFWNQMNATHDHFDFCQVDSLASDLKLGIYSPFIRQGANFALSFSNFTEISSFIEAAESVRFAKWIRYESRVFWLSDVAFGQIVA